MLPDLTARGKLDHTGWMWRCTPRPLPHAVNVCDVAWLQGEQGVGAGHLKAGYFTPKAGYFTRYFACFSGPNFMEMDPTLSPLS